MDALRRGPEAAAAEELMCGGRRFIAVNVSSLRLDTVTGFDIYLPSTASGDGPVLYRGKSLPITHEVLKRIEENGLHKVMISAAEEAVYRRYVEDNLSHILADHEVETTEKCQLLYSSARGLVEDVLKDPRSGEVIPRSKQFVDNAVQFMYTEKAAFEQLMHVTSFDYYTYTHSVNVFVFSISLAQKLGFDEPTVRIFGQGSLLHDIGKSKISAEIINCRGRLTPEQWEIMKMHPVYGWELLREEGVTNEVILDVTRHHHEKMHGNGYPDGLSGDQITPLVRISTIADIFDALTTRRSYKEAMPSFSALKMMKEQMIADLDADYFKAFVELMGRHGQ